MHPRRHPGDLLVHYGIDHRRAGTSSSSAVAHARPTAALLLTLKQPGCQRGGHGRAHRRRRPRRLHPPGRHRSSPRSACPARHARHGQAGCRGRGRRRHVGGQAHRRPMSSTRSARWRRGSRPVSAGSGRPPRDAAAQHRRGRRAPCFTTVTLMRLRDILGRRADVLLRVLPAEERRRAAHARAHAARPRAARSVVRLGHLPGRRGVTPAHARPGRRHAQDH